MVLQSPTPKSLQETSSETHEKKPLSARDRLLMALHSAPHLSQEDAEAINAIVREAREASLADELHR